MIEATTILALVIATFIVARGVAAPVATAAIALFLLNPAMLVAYRGDLAMVIAAAGFSVAARAIIALCTSKNDAAAAAVGLAVPLAAMAHPAPAFALAPLALAAAVVTPWRANLSQLFGGFLLIAAPTLLMAIAVAYLGWIGGPDLFDGSKSVAVGSPSTAYFLATAPAWLLLARLFASRRAWPAGAALGLALLGLAFVAASAGLSPASVALMALAAEFGAGGRIDRLFWLTRLVVATPIAAFIVYPEIVALVAEVAALVPI